MKGTCPACGYVAPDHRIAHQDPYGFAGDILSDMDEQEQYRRTHRLEVWWREWRGLFTLVGVVTVAHFVYLAAGGFWLEWTTGR